MKKAFITGVGGQDGSWLAELLLEKGYKVYGLVQRTSKPDYGNSEHLIGKVEFIVGDMTDMPSLINAIKISMPDEVYNLAAQSFVGMSFTNPAMTTAVNAVGVYNLLEAVKLVKPDTRVYHASTSEMFGEVREVPQKETTPFNPRSPYGNAKVDAHFAVMNYREGYGMYACSGILFNHESERRGIEFVTRKITNAVAKISLGKQDVLELGNLSAKRDWGHAKDYVKAMWLMLQQPTANDYVIATGETRTVREFVERAFAHVGIKIKWQGEGVDEIGICEKTKKILVKVNPEFFRPTEVELLVGDSSKAQKELGWKREIDFDTLVKLMVENDLKLNK